MKTLDEGPDDSTAGGALALYIVDMGLIPQTLYVPLNPPEVIPEYIATS